MSAYTTVLVGTDGSESSFRAVDRAAAVAKDAGAKLLLVTAYHPMSPREVQAAAEALGGEAYKVAGSRPAEDVLRGRLRAGDPRGRAGHRDAGRAG
jgi:nucleotide-binding universal stress UspA family protein